MATPKKTSVRPASRRPASARKPSPAVTRGRIRQSIAFWCFQASARKWSLEKTCAVARELGCESVEVLYPEQLSTLKPFGLTCACVQIHTEPDPPFVRGFNNPSNWPRLLQATREAIDGAAAHGAPSVFCFTGYSAMDPADPRSRQLSPEEGARNCVEGFKKIVGYAESKKVTLCLENLNTRVSDHPMKGHPGYQGDHVDYCVEQIIRPVGSPRLKLLFDVYHAQVMDGDIIARLRKYRDYIGHVHTAGAPGRCELDEHQEINYRAVMEALAALRYRGFVGHEFIPTRDPYAGLREAVTLCDV